MTGTDIGYHSVGFSSVCMSQQHSSRLNNVVFCVANVSSMILSVFFSLIHVLWTSLSSTHSLKQ